MADLSRGDIIKLIGIASMVYSSGEDSLKIVALTKTSTPITIVEEKVFISEVFTIYLEL